MMNDEPLNEELSPELQQALDWMLDAQPTCEELNSAIGRLTIQPPIGACEPIVEVTRRTSGWANYAWTLSIASSIFMLCFIASTEAWGQVAQDYADPLNEPQPISTLAEPSGTESDADSPPGFGMRVLLLSHVLTLIVGIMAMAAAWITICFRCTLGQWLPSNATFQSRRLECRCLILGIALYASGILLGCYWADLTWGSPWRWHPKEAFGLCTLAISSLWLGVVMPRNSNKQLYSVETAGYATLATIAFGSVILMIPLGDQFSAVDQHAYRASIQLPTWIVVFFLTCNAGTWISSILVRVRQSSHRLSKAE